MKIDTGPSGLGQGWQRLKCDLISKLTTNQINMDLASIIYLEIYPNDRLPTAPRVTLSNSPE